MQDILRFFRDAYDELRRVNWLTRQQMIASTWLVILLVIFFAIYVGIVDFIISWAFRFFI